MSPSEEQLLRGAFADVWAARGTERYRTAIERLLEVRDLWPLIAAERAIAEARAELAREQDREIADALALLRSTQPEPRLPTEVGYAA